MTIQDRILLHTLKHNPRRGEVYITWSVDNTSETFCGTISSIEVRRDIDEPATFSISGYIQEEVK